MPPLLAHLVLVAGLVFVLCQCVVFGLWLVTYLAAEGPFPRFVLGMLVTGGVVIAWHLTPLAGFDRHRPLRRACSTSSSARIGHASARSGWCLQSRTGGWNSETARGSKAVTPSISVENG